MKHFIILLSLSILAPLIADDYQFYQDQLNADQQKEAIHLEKEIMAPCCFGGPVYSHGKNDLTEKVRVDIRRLLVAGKTEDEILDFFRNQIDPRTGMPYGNRILAAPKSDELLGRVSYWSMAGFVILGLGILVLVIRGLRRSAPVEEAAPPTEVESEVLEQIEAELAERD